MEKRCSSSSAEVLWNRLDCFFCGPGQTLLGCVIRFGPPSRGAARKVGLGLWRCNGPGIETGGNWSQWRNGGLACSARRVLLLWPLEEMESISDSIQLPGSGSSRRGSRWESDIIFEECHSHECLK